MLRLTQSILPGVFCVAAGFVFAWLAMRLWNLLHPAKPTTGRQLPTDNTTAAAGMMVAAALNIQDRLRDAEVGGAPISHEELIQLDRGGAHILSALTSLNGYESRKYRKLCLPIDFGLPVSECGAGLHEPEAATHHSTTPKLQHSN